MSQFDLTRAVKPATGPVIKRILVRCPSTGKLTDTGQTVEEEAWADTKVRTQKLTCKHCGGVHDWTKKDVILGRSLTEPVASRAGH